MTCSKPRLPDTCHTPSAAADRVQVNGGNPATTEINAFLMAQRWEKQGTGGLREGDALQTGPDKLGGALVGPTLPVPPPAPWPAAGPWSPHSRNSLKTTQLIKRRARYCQRNAGTSSCREPANSAARACCTRAAQRDLHSYIPPSCFRHQFSIFSSAIADRFSQHENCREN